MSANVQNTKEPGSLFQWAHLILNTADPDEKCRLSYKTSELWVSGVLPILASDQDKPLVPDEPARPAFVEQVDPRKVKSGSKKAMIHAITHAESYAIDLSWDIILRFGMCNPELGFMDQELSKESTESHDINQLMPREFFDDWVQVALEEAKHYKKWSLRLKELDSSYGELPAHGGLWMSAKDTSHSLLARLAVVHMVHEARGLDVYPGMIKKFEKSEDSKSICILDANHLEEITHVAAGRKWFDWICKAQNVESVTTFHSIVKRNFKGALKPPFNHEKRRMAGLTEEWYMPLAQEA